MGLGWPFIVTYRKTITSVLPASAEEILRVFHDPPAMVHLNPLVTKCEALDPSKPNRYTVTDVFTIMKMFKASTTYTVDFVPTRNGTDTEVEAAAWTRLSEQWRVVKKDSNESEVTEKITVNCLFCFLPFIIITLSSAHNRLLERLSEKINAEPRLNSALGVALWYINGHFINLSFIQLFILYLSICVWWYRSTTKKSSDPYGLFHLSLNRLPGESEESPPKTEWLNMGYWKDTNIFPEASLALKLIQTARCKEGGKVLDVGHGTGESLILLLTHPSIPRPSQLTGITSIPLHSSRTLERVNRLENAERTISLHAGDAIYRKNSAASGHPFNPSASHAFDTIVALDCAYHFNTRKDFLRQAFERLEPEGRIALADICFDNVLPMGWTNTLVRRFLNLMPKENALSIDEYARCLEELGYMDVVVEDISSDVFPDFVHFLKQRGLGWWIFGSVIQSYYAAGARFVVASGTRPA